MYIVDRHPICQHTLTATDFFLSFWEFAMPSFIDVAAILNFEALDPNIFFSKTDIATELLWLEKQPFNNSNDSDIVP